MTDILVLDTPCLLLDRSVVQRNTERMRARMQRHEVVLRPHLKTAKSTEVARLALGGDKGPVTVSTLREAEYFFEQGFDDIFYAVGIVPSKLPHVDALAARGASLRVVTDSADVASAITSFARTARAPVKVLIEIDSGDGRAGVLPGSAALIDIAGALGAGKNVELLGVMTHAGQSYGCSDAEGVREVAECERDSLVQAADRLRAAGHECTVVSGGSTPTAVYAEDLSGVTEMRPGVYVFFDLAQLAIGSCKREDLALSVLASVIGHNRHVGHIVTDAGALALSKDLSANEARPETGYGELCDVRSLAPLGPLHVKKVSQEHGIVPVPESAWFERLPVGSKVRVLPNHACITAAAHAQYRVVAGGTVVATWERVNGW